MTFFPLLVSEEGWLSGCPLNMACCNICLNELRGGLPPSDLAVCQAQISQWEEHRCCQFLVFLLTLVPSASLNSPCVLHVLSLDTRESTDPITGEMLLEISIGEMRKFCFKRKWKGDVFVCLCMWKKLEGNSQKSNHKIRGVQLIFTKSHMSILVALNVTLLQVSTANKH